MPRKNSNAKPLKRPLSQSARKRQKVLTGFQNYINSYVNTFGTEGRIEHISDKDMIDDFIYGIGISIDYKEYHGPDGFKRFKKELSEKFLMEVLSGRN